MEQRPLRQWVGFVGWGWYLSSVMVFKWELSKGGGQRRTFLWEAPSGAEGGE